MRLPPVRLSLRRWMVAVAGVAIALGGYRAWQLSNLATGYRVSGGDVAVDGNRLQEASL